MSALPFAQYVDGMMGERPLLNQPLQLVGFFLMTYLASHTDGAFNIILLVTLLGATSPSLVGGLMLPLRRLTTFNAESLTWKES